MSQRILKVGVDLDGCMYDYAGEFTKYVSQRKGEHLAYPSTWHFYREQWGLTTDEFLTYMDEAVRDEGIFRHGTPILGSVEAVRELMALGHEVHIVTHREQPGAEDSTRAWLRDWDIPFTSLTFSKDKTVVKTDMFIDDRIENFIDLRANGVDAYLFAQDWNDSHDTLYKVLTWEQFVDRVKSKAASDEHTVIDPRTGGAKGQKLARFDLLPWDVLNTDAELYGRGAEKYQARNWEKGYNLSLSAAALGRHFAALMQGEWLDPETGQPHAAAVRFHAAVIMRFHGTEFDDLPTG